MTRQERSGCRTRVTRVSDGSQAPLSRGLYGLGKFWLNCIRVAIGCYHFFSESDAARDVGILQTYQISCDLIDQASRLDKDGDFAYYCPFALARLVTLAAMVVLRVHRSHLAAILDRQKGDQTILKVVEFAKKRILQNNDLDARTVTVVTQLWASTRAFKYKDGTVDGLRLLLRGRLVSCHRCRSVGYGSFQLIGL